MSSKENDGVEPKQLTSLLVKSVLYNAHTALKIAFNKATFIL